MTNKPKNKPVFVSTDAVIAHARLIAGTDDPAVIIEVLARMVIQAVHGASAGFSRLPPTVDVVLRLDVGPAL